MKNPRQFIFKLLISAGLLIFLLSRVDLNTIIDTLLTVDQKFFIIACLLVLFNFFPATWRWKLLLTRFTNKKHFKQLYLLVCLSRFYNVCIPGNFLGDIIRGLKSNQHDLNRTQGVASIVIERIMGLMSFIFFAFIGVLGVFDILRETHLLFQIFIIIAVIFFILFVVSNKNVITLFDNKYIAHIEILGKLRKFLSYLQYYKNDKGLLKKAFMISLLTSLVNICVFYMLALSLDVYISFFYFLFFIPIINIASIVPISHGGLGVREVSFYLLFTKVGMSQTEAISISLLFFCVLIITAIIGGTIYLIFQKD